MLHFRLYLGRWRGAPNWLRDRSRKPAGRKPLVGSSPTPSATSPHFTRSAPIPHCLWDSDPQGEGCGGQVSASSHVVGGSERSESKGLRGYPVAFRVSGSVAIAMAR